MKDLLSKKHHDLDTLPQLFLEQDGYISRLTYYSILDASRKSYVVICLNYRFFPTFITFYH